MSRPIPRPQYLLSPPRTHSATLLQRLTTPATLHHTRPFTHSPPRLVNANMIKARQERQLTQMLAQAQPSITVTGKKASEKKVPNDLGLMPGTLIMPGRALRPALWSRPVDRVKVEFRRAWKRIKDFVSVVAVAKFMQKPRGKIELSKTKTIAMGLHRQMYTAFAEADNLTLNSICTEGLRDRFRARIGSRAAGERYAWTLHGYVGTPRVMSNRSTVMPIEDALDRRSSLRQAVVRICSRQSLRRVPGRGAAGGGGEFASAGADGENDNNNNKADVKEITEFVVIQKRVFRGAEEKWKIWGTTEETRMKDMAEALNPTLPEVKNGRVVPSA